MAFVGRSKKVQQQFDTPEEMYLRGGLRRTGDAVSSLWIHQGDVLRAYAQKHQDTADIALELPTGTGKTLPGLLIAEWVRRKAAGPVLYATPTKQLARQVLATAHAEGVPARLLVGSHLHWNVTDHSDVDGGEAIAITTYSSIFNSSPKLPVPNLIVFDDAHAGEQFVGEHYSVEIRRYEDEPAYLAVLDALRPFMSGLQIQRLQGVPDPGAHHQVRLILPAVKPGAPARLDTTLSNLGDSYKFDFAMIRSGLAACCVYVSYGGIQIRPMIPPTFQNSVFSSARQRVYLSATLGAGGELERAFGRAEIVRMPLPTKTPPRSGRRLFIFPDLVKGGDAVGLAKDVVAITNKALVLSQTSSEKTEDAARSLAGRGVAVFGKDSVEHGLAVFAQAPTGVLGLANRYDGMDLPGEDCRIVVLDGRPDTVSLQGPAARALLNPHAAKRCWSLCTSRPGGVVQRSAARASKRVGEPGNVTVTNPAVDFGGCRGVTGVLECRPLFPSSTEMNNVTKQGGSGLVPRVHQAVPLLRKPVKQAAGPPTLFHG
ncbi:MULTISPECIES: DEAD/DEAH box helicase [Mycobacterium ulcerans group]|uniref:DEAD/DEAH box helicase n=1 Tax=Mycobacterium ulcerans group TaxID=2993898 RepID=UPI00068763DB|nr:MULTISPECIES: DEAD/DEAH box helicase [Mycobacterium ulcerans group]